MKKILILEQEDVKNIYDTYGDTDSLLNSKIVIDEDIVLLRLNVDSNKDYYTVWKWHGWHGEGLIPHDLFIHKKDIADYIAGKSVKLYNIKDIRKEINEAKSNNIVLIPKNEHINFLYRMELND